MKTIERKCVVCGRKIIIRLKERGKYTGGHFFGKISIPIDGTGKYKTAGSMMLAGEKVKVVKWTGKEKKIEYWECGKCFRKK